MPAIDFISPITLNDKIQASIYKTYPVLNLGDKLDKYHNFLLKIPSNQCFTILKKVFYLTLNMNLIVD